MTAQQHATLTPDPRAALEAGGFRVHAIGGQAVVDLMGHLAGPPKPKGEWLSYERTGDADRDFANAMAAIDAAFAPKVAS